jgi:hypothetical protein
MVLFARLVCFINEIHLLCDLSLVGLNVVLLDGLFLYFLPVEINVMCL